MTEEEREGSLNILVVYCGATKALLAHAGLKKGADDEGYIVEQLKQDVLWLGHHRIVMRSDNDPALLQVIERVMAVLKMAGVDPADEGSVPHDPQTNGAAESAVRMLKGTVKANLMSMERKLQARLPLDQWQSGVPTHERG